MISPKSEELISPLLRRVYNLLGWPKLARGAVGKKRGQRPQAKRVKKRRALGKPFYYQLLV
jgi:hypothetical protein